MTAMPELTRPRNGSFLRMVFLRRRNKAADTTKRPPCGAFLRRIGILCVPSQGQRYSPVKVAVRLLKPPNEAVLLVDFAELLFHLGGQRTS